MVQTVENLGDHVLCGCFVLGNIQHSVCGDRESVFSAQSTPDRIVRRKQFRENWIKRRWICESHKHEKSIYVVNARPTTRCPDGGGTTGFRRQGA
jgi:hypothetical protein